MQELLKKEKAIDFKDRPLSYKIGVFLELIEFKAKSASVFPFILACLYSYYNYDDPDLSWGIILLFSMFIFNAAVDAWDNYCDYYNAKEGHNYKEKTNIIGREGLRAEGILKFVIISVLISACLGLWVAFNTSLIIIGLGIYCFAVGIFYSYGPKPISATPFGEFFSGTTMGSLIILITVIVVTNSGVGPFYHAYRPFEEILKIILFSMPTCLAISSLMLANNSCDVEEDKLNKRYTLAVHLGQEKALRLMGIFYGLVYVQIVINVVAGLAPATYLLCLVSLPLVWKNYLLLKKDPVKNRSFKFAVKNLALIMLLQIIFYLLGLVLL